LNIRSLHPNAIVKEQGLNGEIISNNPEDLIFRYITSPVKEYLCFCSIYTVFYLQISNIHFTFVGIILLIILRTVLKDIVKISTGIYTKPDAFGNTLYLQAKHFKEDGSVDLLPKPEICLDNKNEKHLLKTGDILFAAKGIKNFAAVFNGNIGNAVASSTFLILRINNQYISKILPEYLEWWLNHNVNQKSLKNLAIGSALPSISKAALQELEIIIPEMEKQKLVLKISELRKKESNYILEINKLRELLIQHKIFTSINI